MITLSLDAPEPWATNLRTASDGWPPGVGIHSGPGRPTVSAEVRDPRGPARSIDAVPASTASAFVASREPMVPAQLTSWVRRCVRRLPEGSSVEWQTDDEVHETPLPPGASAVRECRREVVRLFGKSSRVDDLVLAASELTSNAVQHGSGPTSLVIIMSAAGVVIEVGDNAPTRAPSVLPLRPSTWSGRGMAIVDVISDRWGVLALDANKVVWCEFLGLRAQSTR